MRKRLLSQLPLIYVLRSCNKLTSALCMVIFCISTLVVLQPKAYGQTPAYPFPITSSTSTSAPYLGGKLPSPSVRNTDDVTKAYTAWKDKYVTSTGACGFQRVIFDYYPGTTRGATDKSLSVSEGIGYGMLIAAYMGDKSLFDNLWGYYKANRNGNGVMNWKIKNCAPTTTPENGSNGATDAELDAAMALIVASYQWQSDVYLNDAKTLIRIIREKEFESGTYVQKPGDMFGGSNLTNPSYFSPAYYRVFKLHDGNASFWDAAAAKGYQIIAAAGGTTGLVPDWCSASGGVASGAGSYEDQGKNFIFDAIRTPLRSGIDYLWHGGTVAPEAKAYCEKITGWLNTSTGGNPANIGSKYGTKLNNNEGQKLNSDHNNTFVGCFGVSTMAATDGATNYQTFIDKLYTENKTVSPRDGEYFNATIKLITLLIQTGNFYMPPPDKCSPPDLGADKSLCSGNPLTIGPSNITDTRTYVWKQNNTTLSSTTKTISVTTPGVYEVIAKDAAGCTRRDQIEIFDAAVKADFSFQALATTVNFTSTSTGGVSGYSWKYAGTEFATTANASKVFPQAGKYDVTLTVNNSAFGCTGTSSITKSVVVGNGVGVAFDDFNNSNNVITWVSNTVAFKALPKTHCSRDDYDDGKSADCPNNPCSLFEVTALGAGTTQQYATFGLDFKNGVAYPNTKALVLDLSGAPYASIKLRATAAVKMKVSLKDPTTASKTPGNFINIPANKDTIITLDYTLITKGYDAGGVEKTMDYTKIQGIQFNVTEDNPLYKGTVDIDWVIVGSKALPAPIFDIKRDELGFPVYEDPDGDKVYTTVTSWSRVVKACGTTTTLKANSCTAEQIRWYSGKTLLGSGSSLPNVSAGKYYVELVNQGGVTRDSVEVFLANVKADFAVSIEESGRAVRLLNNSTDFDTWAWDYGATPSNPLATGWEEGFNYYSADGTYKVCLTVTNTLCAKTDKLCKNVDIKCYAPLGNVFNYTAKVAGVAKAIVNDTLTVCPGQTVVVALDSVSNAASYGWFATSVASLSSTKSVSTTFATASWLKTEAYNVCGEKVADSIYIKALPKAFAKFTATPKTGLTYTFDAQWVGDAPGATYSWFVDGATTATFTGLKKDYTFTSGGTHQVKLTVTNSCGTDDTTMSIGCALPDVTGLSVAGKPSVCAGETCTMYSITPVTGATSYTWTIPGATSTICTGGTTNSITATVTGSGDLSVVANNSCGASSKVSLVVSVTPAPSTPAINGKVSPGCSAQGEIYNIPGATQSSTYAWTVPTGATIASGQGTSSIVVNFGTTNGSISVIETTSGGCKGAAKSLAYTLSGCNLAADFKASVATVCEGADVVFTDLSAGASATAAYSWNFGAGATPATSTSKGPVTVKYTGSGAKNVTLTITDGLVSTKTKDAIVTVNPLPSAAGTMVGTPTACGGSKQTYSIGTVANATSYVWTVPTGATFTGTGTSIEVTFGTTSGDVTVTPKNDCGNGTASKVTVTISGSVTTSAINGKAAPGCNAKGEVYSVTKTQGSTYTWTVPTGAIIQSGQGSDIISVDFGSTNGTISVVETSANSCVGAARTLPVTLAGCGLAANFQASVTTACAGTDVTFTDMSTGTTATATYTWNFGTDATPSTATGKGPHKVKFANAGSKSVSLTVVDGATVTANKADYITISPLPSSANDILGLVSVCSGSTQSYSTTAASNATDYAWTIPTGATKTGTGLSVAVTFGTTTGSISVTPSNACGVGTAKTIQVTVNATPSTSEIAGNAAPTCSGSATYNITGGQGSTYSWTVPTGATISGVASASSITVNFGTSNGDITVQETSASGCKGAVKKLAITLSGCNLAPNFSASATNVCDGSEVTFTDLTTGSSANTIYSWSFGTGATPATITGKGPHKVVYTGTGVKNVALTVTEGTKVLTETKNQYLTVNPKPSAAGTITGEVSVCPNAVKTYSITPVSNALSYTWTAPAGATVAGTGTSVNVTFGTTTGDITVTPTNTCGSGTAAKLTVTVNPAPATSAITGKVNPTCQEASVSYNVTPTQGSTYQWSVPSGATIKNGQGLNAITVDFGSSNGSVSVIETTSGGCTGTAKTLAVTLSGCGLNADFSVSPQSACVGSTVTFTNISSAAATATYSWNFGAGATPATATGVGPHKVSYSSVGSKTVALTVTEGSATDTETKSAFVTVSDKPAAAGAITGSLTACAGAIENYSVAPVAGATSYTWTVPSGSSVSGNTNDVKITFGSVGGPVSVQATNTCGSSAASSIQVSVGNTVAAQVSVTTPTTTVNKGEKVTFTAKATNGGSTPSYTWYVNDNAVSAGSATYATATLADQDVVYVIMKSNSSCASPSEAKSTPITITVVVPPPGYASAGADQETCGATVTLEGNTPDCGTGAWTLVSGLGNISNKALPKPLVTGLGVGGNVFRWTVTCNGTTKFDDVTINVVRPAVEVEADVDEICEGSQVTFTATGVNGGNSPSYQWKLNGDNVGTNSPTFSTTTLVDGDGVRVVMTSSLCTTTATSNTVKVSIIEKPSAANAGVDITTAATSATLLAVDPSVGTGEWSKVSGTGVIDDVTSNTTLVDGLSAGANKFKWTVSNGICPASADEVIVTLGNKPASNGITGPNSVTSGQRATYSVPATAGNEYFWEVPAGATIISGQGTNEIVVEYGSNVSGAVSVTETNQFGSTKSSKSVGSGNAPSTQTISGPKTVLPNATATYSVAENANSSYNWTVPTGASIVGGQGTNEITVQFGESVSGQVAVTETNSFGTATSNLPVETSTKPDAIVDAANGISFDLYPNPCSTDATLRVNSFKNTVVSVKVIDVKGIVVAELNDLSSNMDVQLGDNLKSGVYTIQVKYDDRSQFLKLIKVE